MDEEYLDKLLGLVENEVSMGCASWDTVDPYEIIKAVIKHHEACKLPEPLKEVTTDVTNLLPEPWKEEEE